MLAETPHALDLRQENAASYPLPAPASHNGQVLEMKIVGLDAHKVFANANFLRIVWY